MKIFALITLIFNILTIIVLSIGIIHKFENPKNKAVYGYIIAANMIPYLILLSIFALLEIFTTHIFSTILFLFSIISPFIIGKLVKYETLQFYTVIQILCFLLSAVIIIHNYFI